MARRFDHIDLRVRNLAEVMPFYEALLPALGFTRQEEVPGWLQFASGGEGEVAEFFGVTEAPRHVANETRIAFWAESRAEVERIAAVAVAAGARAVEGPMDYAPGYYAVFFEDPSGTRLEVCWREPGAR